MGAQNFKSLKYWTDDELGFMTGLFYSTKILLKTKQKVRLHKTSKMSLIFMNMSRKKNCNEKRKRVFLIMGR